MTHPAPSFFLEAGMTHPAPSFFLQAGMTHSVPSVFLQAGMTHSVHSFFPAQLSAGREAGAGRKEVADPSA